MLLCYSDDAPVVSAASCGAGSLTGVGHERTWRGQPQACETLRIARVVKLHRLVRVQVSSSAVVSAQRAQRCVCSYGARGPWRDGCGGALIYQFSMQVEKAKAQIAVEVYTAMTEALNAK